MFEKIINYFKMNGCKVYVRNDFIVANHKDKHLKIDIYKNTKEFNVFDTATGELIRNGVL